LNPNAPFIIGPEDADRACLLIHGFSGTPAEMRGLGEALADQGIRVQGIVLAGHGDDAEQLVSTGRKHWFTSAEAGLAQLVHYPQVFVVGLSMGGVLSLSLAARYPERIAGVATLSTPTRFSGGWQTRVLPLARHFVKWFYPLRTLDLNNHKLQEEVLKQARLRDPNVIIDFADPHMVAHIKQMIRLPVPALDELMQLTNENRRKLGLVRCPLLIIHSRRDQTVNPACAEELFHLATAASPKSLHWLEESDHVITIGGEREEVFQLVGGFIKARGVAGTARPGFVLQDEGGGTRPGH
jgi:carboxylesterase